MFNSGTAQPQAPQAINVRQPNQIDPVSAHLLPCKVHCSCSSEDEATSSCRHPAKVDVYFDPVIRPTGVAAGSLSEVQSATFRGRPLSGAVIDVPEGYTGTILKECPDTTEVSCTVVTPPAVLCLIC